MGYTSYNIPHTIVRGDTYYFNKRCEHGAVRLSLKTSDRLLAMQYASGLATLINNKQGSKMNLTQLRHIAADWLQTKLDQEYIRRATETKATMEELEREQDNIESGVEFWETAYQQRDYGMAETIYDAIQQKHSLRLDDDHKKVMFRLITQATMEMWQRLGKHEFPSLLDTPPQAHQIQVEEVTEDKGKLFSEVYDDYVELKMNSGDWATERTKRAYINTAKVFLELAGNHPVRHYTKVEAREFSKALVQYPLGRTKGKNTETSLEELRAQGVPTISKETIDGLFSKTTAFFNWMETLGYTETNPFKGMNPIKNKKNSGVPKRSPWERADISKLFSTPQYQEGDFGRSKSYATAYYWVPLIGLYTGARLEEICQMKTSHLKQEDGIYYFDITVDPDDDKASIKSAAGYRKIPVHNHLIELGLLEHHETRVNEERLFHLTYRNGVWSQSLGQWFSTHKEKNGFPKGSPKVFHSFRNTMIRSLTRHEVEERVLKKLLGHDDDSVTRKRYDYEIPIEQLNRAVQSIDWREELAHVRNWRELRSRLEQP